MRKGVLIILILGLAARALPAPVVALDLTDTSFVVPPADPTWANLLSPEHSELLTGVNLLQNPWCALTSGDLTGHNPTPAPRSDPFTGLHISPPTLHTVAQLQAILAAYVGRWSGQYNIYAEDGRKVGQFFIVMDYGFKEVDGKRVLVSTSHYTENGREITDVSRIWIEQGDIFAETTSGGQTEKFCADLQDDKLVWLTLDKRKLCSDYCMIENLSLTADGGKLAIRGYETVPGASRKMAFESADLKLEK